jgi:hypothetical protein
MCYDVILFSAPPIFDDYTRAVGPHRLASELRSKGYSVLIINHTSVLDWQNFTEILDLAIGNNTLCVGFSVTWFYEKKLEVGHGGWNITDIDHYDDKDLWGLKSNNLDWMYETVMYRMSQGDTAPFVNYIKNINLKTKVVVGGATAHDYISDKNFDNIFIGFSENQFIEYIDRLAGKNLKIFNRIVNYDTKGNIGDFDFRNAIVKYDESDFLFPDEILLIEFTRGCIFNCSFCSYPHRAQKTKDFIRYKESIKEELTTNYEKWGITNYTIVDDTFNDHTEKLQLIAEVIRELPFKPKFWAYCRIDLIQRWPEQAQLMYDIGVKEILYGMETWHDETAKIIKKGATREKKIEGFKIAKSIWKDEVSITATMIVGLPKDTLQSFIDFREWFLEEGHNYINGIYPGALVLRNEDPNTTIKFISDMEKNIGNYGYSFLDKEKPYNWTREGGDINTFEQADNFAREYELEFDRYNATSVLHHQIQTTACMQKMAVLGKINSCNAFEISNAYCKTNYFPSLINYLKDRKNSQ